MCGYVSLARSALREAPASPSGNAPSVSSAPGTALYSAFDKHGRMCGRQQNADCALMPSKELLGLLKELNLRRCQSRHVSLFVFRPSYPIRWLPQSKLPTTANRHLPRWAMAKSSALLL